MPEAKSEHLKKYGSEKNLDFWEEASSGLDEIIMISPEYLTSIKSWLEKEDIKFSVVQENVQELIDKDMASIFAEYKGKI